VLWLKMSARLDHGPDRIEVALEIGRQHLDGVLAPAADGANVRANIPAPPSRRSSRSTDVITACEGVSSATNPPRAAARRSSSVGAPDVTAQKRQARVQTSEIMKVAVRRFQAIEDVRTAPLFAHRVQPAPAHDLLELLEVSSRCAHADPLWNLTRRQRSRLAHSLMPARPVLEMLLDEGEELAPIMPSDDACRSSSTCSSCVATAMPSHDDGRRTSTRW